MKAYAESFIQEELKRGRERERERELKGDGLEQKIIKEQSIIKENRKYTKRTENIPKEQKYKII